MSYLTTPISHTHSLWFFLCHYTLVFWLCKQAYWSKLPHCAKESGTPLTTPPRTNVPWSLILFTVLFERLEIATLILIGSPWWYVCVQEYSIVYSPLGGYGSVTQDTALCTKELWFQSVTMGDRIPLFWWQKWQKSYLCQYCLLNFWEGVTGSLPPMQ